MTAITIVTDAWHPQVNGVVRSIENTVGELPGLGHRVMLLTPDRFSSIPCPTYPEIRLSLASFSKVSAELERQQPSFLHIATEGPLGLQARRWCLRRKMPFTTCYHTRFPEYVAARLPVPLSLTYAYARWFHNAGAACMVATETLERELADRGLKRLVRWSRGVDTHLFHPAERIEKPFDLPRPIFLTVGRIAPEKNLSAFLDLDLPGSKVVIGDGPARADLQRRYPQVRFAGVKFGVDLADAYAQGDVFVFPSRTDTFGNTILEALASGVPVAAYPVTGPVDILGGEPQAGALDDDLRQACLRALDLSGRDARALAERYSWAAAAGQFLDNVMRANAMHPARAKERPKPLPVARHISK